jgi:hypothetical protein
MAAAICKPEVLETILQTVVTVTCSIEWLAVHVDLVDRTLILEITEPQGLARVHVRFCGVIEKSIRYESFTFYSRFHRLGFWPCTVHHDA